MRKEKKVMKEKGREDEGKDKMRREKEGEKEQ